MRDARAEARDRLSGRFDARVLEPSPPPIREPPFFADDPVAGGQVVPVERPGCRSWSSLCQEENEDALRDWCEDRWLMRGPLASLPEGFTETRKALHAVAEHLLAPARHADNGKIGLRFCYHGFGTPFFGHDRQLRIEDGDLVDGDQRHGLTTLGQAAELVSVVPGAPEGIYEPSSALDLEADLVVDARAARALGDWFGFCASILEQLREDATPGDQPARVQLWPEHFDIAVDLGPEGARANFGGSPGDTEHAEPYLYIGPWDQRRGAFWNESFGASLSYQQLLAGADGLAFFRQGRDFLLS